MEVVFGCWYPSSEVIVEKFDCVGIPLSVEVIIVVWLSALSLYCKVDFVWPSAHPSKCRGDSCCVLPLV